MSWAVLVSVIDITDSVNYTGFFGWGWCHVEQADYELSYNLQVEFVYDLYCISYLLQFFCACMLI